MTTSTIVRQRKNNMKKTQTIDHMHGDQTITREENDPKRLNLILLGHVHSQIYETIRISPFVVVPRHKLHEIIIQSDASTDIEDGGRLTSHEVRRHDLIRRPV